MISMILATWIETFVRLLLAPRPGSDMDIGAADAVPVRVDAPGRMEWRTRMARGRPGATGDPPPDIRRGDPARRR
jgi:hypothetical protein